MVADEEVGVVEIDQRPLSKSTVTSKSVSIDLDGEIARALEDGVEDGAEYSNGANEYASSSNPNQKMMSASAFADSSSAQRFT